MQFDHVIVSSEELSQIEQIDKIEQIAQIAQIAKIENIGEPPYSLFGSGYATVPRWALLVFAPAVLLLPLLCLLAVVSRVALRAQSISVKYAWAAFFATLLTISGVLSSAAAIAFLWLPRMPAVLSTNIPDFDEREGYPHLPFWGNLESAEVSIELKPLVIVVSPITRIWGGGSSAQAEYGAGVLLLANKEGYLFATAKHLVSPAGKMEQQAMVSTASGMRASADVVAIAQNADLALLWVNRRTGSAVFTQPVGKASDGEAIFVIGHPEGLNYSQSTGTVSGLRGTDVRITAPISPGNSGGPVYDVHGNLLGIVSSQFDRERNVTADNPGYATTAELFEDKSGWKFKAGGELRLQQYIQALGGS